MTDAIRIEGVTRRFLGNIALENLSAVIGPGCITGLVGPDGAGKTTLMRLMAGLLLPDEGAITVCGFDTVREAADIHAILAYMPQKFGLYEDLTVRENLELYARLRGIRGEEKRASFGRMLEFTSLQPFTGRLAGKLSGGMKQKLGLACALLAKPRVLLLDEPSVGVDPISRRELWKMVKELAKEGMIVVWSTAYLDEAEACDAVILLNEGRLLFADAPAVLSARAQGRTFTFESPLKERRQALMALFKRRDVLDGVIQGTRIRVVLKEAKDASRIGIPLTSVPPRFEDAFIDLLGGVKEERSLLAERIHTEEENGAPPIEAKNLTKRFGDFTAAEDISFQVKRGEIFGLLGPNGAGKSTTFKMLCGLLKPSSGEARVAGLNLETSTSEARARIGYMAQKFSLYGDLNVKHNLNFFSGAYGLTGAKRAERVEEMIEIFALKPYLASNAGTLPLGFKQRLSLACAVMHRPDVLFLDEPTSGVDPVTRREFWLHINALAEKGVTVMVTTHFMDEAEYCDRIALIYRAGNIASGTPDELKRKAASERLPDPSLEDAFIALIEQWDSAEAERRAA